LQQLQWLQQPILGRKSTQQRVLEQELLQRAQAWCTQIKPPLLPLSQK
jgi:hypothetical protein